MADGKPTAEGSPKDWRGVSTSAAAPVPEYRWKSDARETVPLHTRRANVKRRLRLLALGSLIAAISTAFLVELLFSPPRTPMIVIAPSEYEWPFQPLSWIQEDLEGFRSLDRETLDIHAIDVGWKTKDQGLRQLDLKLQNIVRQSHRPHAIVLYLRMHSAVDGVGTACLVPPGASPFNSDSWLPVKDILERFKQQNVPDSIPKLVILDCQNVLVSWKQGIVFNTFAARLPETVSDAAIPNLTVLSAAGPTQTAATSVELRHGVFAHFLRLGLAGAADAESGNGDRLVSVRELHRYLARNVNEWSLRTRGSAQQPQLIPFEPVDFDVTTVFNARATKRVDPTSRLASNTASIVSANELNQLWKKLDESQSLDPIRFHPIEYTELEDRLCWLERASDSGAAYARSARRLFHELQQKLEATEPSNADDRSPRAFPNRWAKLNHEPILSAPAARMSSLALNDFFGATDPTSAENYRSIIGEFKKSPSEATLNMVVQSISGNIEYAQLEITCLLRLWQRYGVARLWPNSPLLSTAIELHELSESASVPSDERALEWIRPFIDAADGHRRRIDDRSFLGGDPPEAEITEARRLYHQASQIAVEVSRAYATRDRLDHSLPFFAEYLARPPLDGHVSSMPLAAAKSLLFDLLHKLELLEDALSNPVATAGGDSVQLPFQRLLSDIDTQFKQLTDHLAGEYDRLLQTNELKPEIWNGIDGLLSMPLLPSRNERLELAPAQQRGLLREKRAQLGRKLVDRPQEPGPVTGGEARSKDQAASQQGEPKRTANHSHEFLRMGEYLDELLIKVPENLALAMVRREKTRVAPVDSAANSDPAISRHDVETIAETQGRRFRQFMLSVSEITQSDTERQMAAMDRSVLQNSLGERVLRASASVMPTRVKVDPISARRSEDLRRLLLWQSRRVLDDFWGSQSPEEPPFFDVAASTLLRTAGLTGKPTVRSLSEAKDLDIRLKRYRTAAAGGLTTVSDNLFIADGADPIVAKIAVYQKIRDDLLFPEGKGAVCVRNSAGEPLGLIHELEIPWAISGSPNATATQFDIELPGVDPHERSIDLKAVTSFRGHDFSGDLSVNSISGVIVDYTPNARRESRIAIRGLKLRKLSVVFVLDCSNSMGQELPLETDRVRGSRLRIAKLALDSMLEKLAEDDRHRVGVICFGHRIGWDLTQAGQLLRQTGYGVPIPDQVRPYDDVETILPLGRFNPSFASMVNERLISVKPWGESPFYLALIQALKLFENDDDDDSDKCVVAITDGMNYQFNPPAGARKSVFDVLAAWRDHRVPIHIVGLGIAADQAATVQREFGELTRQTGGSYSTAQEARTLVESLAAFQRISQFRVRGTLGPDDVAEVGQPITVQTDPQHLSDFEVTLGQAAEIVSLQGGESLELLPTRDSRRLEVPPYEIGQPQFEALVKDDQQNNATDLVTGFHRPFRRGQQVTFDISIQHLQRHFVRRPTEAWIEITPIVRSGQFSPPTYVLYDTNYLPNTSVPVLRWTVNDWPAEASQAKLRVWFKFEESKPISTMTLGEALDPVRNPDMPLDGVAGVNTRVRVRRNGPLQVSIVERHSKESTGVGTLKIGLKSSAIPDRVRHRFDAVNRIATHLFEFTQQDESVLADGSVVFTKRSSAQSGSLRTNDAVIVDVTESKDVHD
ncbi:vWA domain-containing protein [Schlesneria paludicola]|uniref:vWA domain-containing protein n=1 Tax=Schlesneria paludicola TaxID=360056 RepID=UPI00029A9CFC|nr:vWA domain-containing protein [Schlesneria paludicola]